MDEVESSPAYTEAAEYRRKMLERSSTIFLPPHQSPAVTASPQGEGKSPFSSPEAKDLLTLFGDLREEPLEREAVSAAATGLGPLWGPSKTDRDGSRERRWTRATGTQRRLSCGKYRASSGSNEVRAAFARGLELRVLYKLSAKESGEKILER